MSRRRIDGNLVRRLPPEPPEPPPDAPLPITCPNYQIVPGTAGSNEIPAVLGGKVTLRPTQGTFFDLLGNVIGTFRLLCPDGSSTSLPPAVRAPDNQQNVVLQLPTSAACPAPDRIQMMLAGTTPCSPTTLATVANVPPADVAPRLSELLYAVRFLDPLVSKTLCRWEVKVGLAQPLPTSLSLPVTSGSPVTLPVQAKLEWAVQDSGGRPLDSSAFSPRSFETTGAANAVFAFAPAVEEGDIATVGVDAPMVERRIGARLTLSVGGHDVTREVWFTVPVPTVKIPTVLVLFNHAHFSMTKVELMEPSVLIVFPTAQAPVVQPGVQSVESVNQLLGLLGPLRDCLLKLQEMFPVLPRVGGPGNAAAELGGLIEKLNAVAAAGTMCHVRFHRGASVANLSEIVFHGAPFYQQTAEDTFSSLALFGPTGTRVVFYNARNYDASDGAFQITLPDGRLFAVVNSLHEKPPSHSPEGSFLRVQKSWFFGNEDLHDRMSSFQFMPRA